MENAYQGLTGVTVRPMTNIGIRQLQLIETGTYNQMFVRPYSVNFDGAVCAQLSDRIMRAGRDVGDTLLAGLTSEVLKPAANCEAPALIPNDWNTKRVRFMLVIDFTHRTGSKGTYWIQGYTSHAGVSPTGFIDPNMVFYANSCTVTGEQQMLSPMGVITEEVLRESFQILRGNGGDIFTQNNLVYSMRPEDIFYAMQRAHLDYNQELSANGVHDCRSVLSSRPFISNRKSNIPSHYMGKVMNNSLMHTQMAQYLDDTEDVQRRVQQSLQEHPLYENMFFHFISNSRPGSPANEFTLNELIKLQADLANRTRFIKLTEYMRAHSALPTPEAGNSAHWAGVDIVTQKAAFLIESIPAIMMQSLMSVVSFRATNFGMHGQNQIVFSDIRSISKVPNTTIAALFKNLFEQMILPDITMGGMIPYSLEMSCDVSGDTWVTLQLDTQPAMTFSAPSFSDSLYSPVITTSRDHFEETGYKMNTLISHISENLSSQQMTEMLQSTQAAF